MFGHLKTIKVWVVMKSKHSLTPGIIFTKKKWLAELKHVPIITQMGKFPGNKVA
jgi:hypothetical protein